MSHGFMSNGAVAQKRRIAHPNALEKVVIDLLSRSNKPKQARPWKSVERVSSKKNTRLKNLLSKYLHIKHA